jgi:protein-tyrosine-phosphatase
LDNSHSVLFICTANICRSPMAEALLRLKVQETGSYPDTWRIESAGVNALEGVPPSRFAVEVMTEYGFDITDHKSKTATENMLGEFNLVLTMEKIHKQLLRSRFPDSTGKVYMLSEMIDQEFPVEDPFGNSLEDYRKCADVINRLIESGMDEISKLAASNSRLT